MCDFVLFYKKGTGKKTRLIFRQEKYNISISTEKVCLEGGYILNVSLEIK